MVRKKCCCPASKPPRPMGNGWDSSLADDSFLCEAHIYMVFDIVNKVKRNEVLTAHMGVMRRLPVASRRLDETPPFSSFGNSCRVTAPGGKTAAPLPVDNLKLPRTFSEYTEWCYHLTDTCFERSTPRSRRKLKYSILNIYTCFDVIFHHHYTSHT